MECTSLYIHDGFIENIQPALDRANAKAARYGLEGGWKIAEIRPADAIITKSGFYAMSVVILEGTPYHKPGFTGRIAGYKIATGEAIDIVTMCASHADISAREDMHCDHCGPDNRHRTTIAIVEENGELIQLGTSCVERYVGFEFGVKTFVDYFNIELAGDIAAESEKIKQSGVALNPSRIVDAIAEKLISRNLRPFNPRVDRLNLIDAPEFEDLSECVIDELLNAGEDNALDAFERGACSYETAQVIAYHAVKALRGEDSPLVDIVEPARYVGEIGGKVKLVINVTEVRVFDGHYGKSYLIKGETDTGEAVSTFNSGKFGIEAQNFGRFEIAGTVKDHNEEWGETQLTRVTGKKI